MILDMRKKETLLFSNFPVENNKEEKELEELYQAKCMKGTELIHIPPHGEGLFVK